MRDLRTKLIVAAAATASSIVLLFLYLGSRENIADDIIVSAMRYGAEDCMIARESTTRPPESRFEVAFRCEGAPLQGVVVYASDAERARRDAGRKSAVEGCTIVRSSETTKPYCNAQRRCGEPYQLG